MRVLLLAQFLPPVSGGEERHVWNLARALASRDHQVTLLGFATDADSAGETMEDGVRLVRVRTAAARCRCCTATPNDRTPTAAGPCRQPRDPA